MLRIVEKHPLATRWFHWIHFPLLFVMIWSGLLIYWASSENTQNIVVFGQGQEVSNGVYRVGVSNHTLFHFFPKRFWDSTRSAGEKVNAKLGEDHKLGEPLILDHKLAQGMAWHFFFMWLFAINGLIYVLYTLISGEWRYLVPRPRDFADSFQVVLHDLHLRKTLPRYVKYNPAQRIAYTLVILMAGGSLMTGIAIYRPVQFGWVTWLLGGYQMARFEHFWLTIGFLLFFLIHVAQVAKAGWNNFRSMVSGYETQEIPEPAHENT